MTPSTQPLERSWPPLYRVRERGREGENEGRREGGREREGGRGREGGREGGRDSTLLTASVLCCQGYRRMLTWQWSLLGRPMIAGAVCLAMSEPDTCTASQDTSRNMPGTTPYHPVCYSISLSLPPSPPSLPPFSLSQADIGGGEYG